MISDATDAVISDATDAVWIGFANDWDVDSCARKEGDDAANRTDTGSLPRGPWLGGAGSPHL